MRAVALTTAVGVLLAGLVAGSVANDGILLIAHRGDANPADGFPENTLEAFKLALAKGADGIELDVQASAEGTLWLLHDETVDRTTNGTGRINELRDSEIVALRIDGGGGWRPEVTGLGLARLEEVASEGIADAAGRLFVDLKDPDDSLARAVVEWLRAGGWTGKAEVNVKTHAQAAIVHDAGVIVAAQPDWITDAISAPDVDVAIVWGDQLADALALRPACEIELFRHSVSEADLPEAAVLARARELQLRAFVTDDIGAARR